MKTATVVVLGALTVSAVSGVSFLLLAGDGATSGHAAATASAAARAASGPSPGRIEPRDKGRLAAGSRAARGLEAGSSAARTASARDGETGGEKAASPSDARAAAAAASAAKGKDGVAASAAAARDPAAVAREAARIRKGLHDPDARARLAALRDARALGAAELAPDVAALLASERSTPVRRVATQILSQGDVTAYASQLRDLRKDADPVVRVNASFGLARAGDEQEQANLLRLYDDSRRVAPQLLPIVARALEDPALRAPAVMKRFEEIAGDPSLPQDLRDRATAVLKAKRGA